MFRAHLIAHLFGLVIHQSLWEPVSQNTETGRLFQPFNDPVRLRARQTAPSRLV